MSEYFFENPLAPREPELSAKFLFLLNYMF